MLRRSIALAILAVVSIALIGDTRPRVASATQTASDDLPATAAQVTATELDDVRSPVSEAAVSTPASTAAIEALAPAAAPAIEAVAPATAPAAEAPAPETPVVVVQPVQAAPQPVRAPGPVAVAAAPTPAPAACPSDWICYPRVGIAGPIIPYNDCSAATDVGDAIRSITCVSPTYIAGHAYTQFGRITGWRAGDVVWVFGVRYVLYDGFSQGSCAKPTRAPAPLSLQTSLSAINCGQVLVLQGRPG